MLRKRLLWRIDIVNTEHRTIDTDGLKLRSIIADADRSRNLRAPGERLGAELEEMKRHAMIRALEQARYNKTKAAQLLGMTFRSLRYRIKKLGIE